MKNFYYFLNEKLIIKNFQYILYDTEYDNFEKNIIKKSNDLNIELNINKTIGISNFKVLLSLKGDEKSIDNLIDWIKNEYD